MAEVLSGSHILITSENPGGIIIPGRFFRRTFGNASVCITQVLY